MAKNEKLPKTPDKKKYSFIDLLSDIIKSAVGNEEDAQDGEKAKRERLHKLNVVQMLIDLAINNDDEGHQEDGKLRNAINVKVNGDVFLSSYIFYVSHNPQFDYSWNYLRKKENCYKEFLFEGINFLRNMLDDINMLADKPRNEQNIHVVFNDLFDVYLIDKKPFVKTEVLWENFPQLVLTRKNYHLTVKCKECFLVTGLRKEAADAEKLIDATMKMIENKNQVSE